MDEVFNIDDLNLEQSTINQIMNISEENNIGNQPEIEENKVDTTTTETKEGEQNTENKTDENKTDKTSSSDVQEDSSTFSVFANLLKEEGVISISDEELKNIKTSVDLVEAMKKQVEASKFDNLSESQKRYLESVEAGIPSSEFETLEKQLNQLESIDEEQLEESAQTRFDLIAYDLISKGFSKEKAVEFANRSIKLGTDAEDSKEALESLIKTKSEEYKQKIASKKEENKISLEELKKTIDSKDVILKDIKLNDSQKKELYNLISTKVDTDELGQPINELNKWRSQNKLEAEILLGALYLQTNKFQNLGKILDVSKSKASLELEKRLKQNEVMDISNNSISYGKDQFEIQV